MRLYSLVFAAALSLSPVVFADEELQSDLANTPLSPQKDAVLNAVNINVKYSEITQVDRANIESSLLGISGMLAGGKTIASLDGPLRDNIHLYQDSVNKLLVKAFRDSKLVCTKEAAIGSNMLKRLCKTAAATNRDADFARDNRLKVSK